jgi:FMN-dependent NADH-azoreductase
MKILHVSSSPRGPAATSYQLSQTILGFLLQGEPKALLVNRPVGDGSLAPLDADYAQALGATEETPQERAGQGALGRSDALIRELESADVVVIATPMHNFTVSSALKAWIDHIVRVRRTFDVTARGKVTLLRDRPVFVAVSSGGRYSGEQVRQPDYLTPYLRAVFGSIGLHDLTFFSVEGTGTGAVAAAQAWTRAEQAVQAHFCRPGWASLSWRSRASPSPPA